MIKHLSSKRKDVYKPLKLRSYYRSRIDYGDITYSFQAVLEKEFNNYFGIDGSSTMIDVSKNFDLFKSKIMTDVKNIDESIFSNVVFDSASFDTRDKEIELNTHIQFDIKLSEIDIYESFNALIAINLQGFAPKRSIPSVRQSIYVWFKRFIGMSLAGGGVLDIQKIFLHPANIEQFSLLLAKAIDTYRPIKREELIARIEETYYDWDVKSFETYNQHTSIEKPFKHNVYSPTFVALDRSSPESLFEDYLESKGAVLLWWYKNGDSKRDYLGLKYLKDNVPRVFYPDYVIQLKSGKLIIGDTKSGQTAEDSLPKALVLEKYLNLIGEDKATGGIFILDKANRWRVNTTPASKFELSDLTHWLYLDDLLV
jgi:type III restriction enzyme